MRIDNIAKHAGTKEAPNGLCDQAENGPFIIFELVCSVAEHNNKYQRDDFQ